MTTTAHLARAYGALKDLLALIGIASVAGLVFLPWQQQAAPAALEVASTAVEIASAAAAGESDATPVAPAAENAAAAPSAGASAVQTAAVENVLEPEQRAVAAFIARRYRIAERAVAGFVATAYRAGAQYSIDPLLILAVMAVESGYNPVAKSVVGAKGLMQVLPRFHLEKLADHGGETALLEPEVNILVGTRILREYLDRFRDVESALQMYVGSLDNPTSQYAKKVLAERARIEAALKRALGKRQSA